MPYKGCDVNANELVGGALREILLQFAMFFVTPCKNIVAT